MPGGPCTVLGGLPVYAEVWYTRGDGYSSDDDSGVDKLFWLRRDGSPGKEVPQAMYDRLERADQWWEASVTEQVFDHLAHEQWLKERADV